MRDATIKNKGMLKYIASEFRVVVRIEGSWRKADNLLKKVISFNYLQVTTGTCGLTCRQYPYPLCVTWAGTVTVMALFLPKPAGFNPGIIWMTRATLTYYFSHIWIITIGTSKFFCLGMGSQTTGCERTPESITRCLIQKPFNRLRVNTPSPNPNLSKFQIRPSKTGFIFFFFFFCIINLTS